MSLLPKNGSGRHSCAIDGSPSCVRLETRDRVLYICTKKRSMARRMGPMPLGAIPFYPPAGLGKQSMPTGACSYGVPGHRRTCMYNLVASTSHYPPLPFTRVDPA